MELPGTRRIRKTVRRPHIRLLLIYFIVSLLGYAMTRDRTPGAESSGGFTMVVGACGALWEIGRWIRWWWHRRAVREQARLRGERKVLRMAQAAEQRERVRQQRQVQDKAASKQTLVRQEQRRSEMARTQEARAARQVHFKAVAAEATRLQGLSDPLFLAELPTLFALRGLRPHRAITLPDHTADTSDDSCWDIHLMRLEDEGVEVARCVPLERIVTVSDVEALEQWRTYARAEHAYLVARNGFSAPALRMATHYPVTLLEPYVLAQWQVSALKSSAPE